MGFSRPVSAAVSALFGLIFIVVPVRTHPQQVVIPNEVRQGAGEIRLERLAVVGRDPAGPAFSRMTSLAMDRDGYFYAGATYERGELAVFDPTGAFERRFGRRGQGPGEFASPIMRIVVGPGDSIHVFEGPRYTVLAPRAAGFGRLRNLPVNPRGAAFTPEGRLIVVGPASAPEGVRLVHIMDADGEVVESLAAAPDFDFRRSHAFDRAIANAPDGNLWVGHATRYMIELWSPGTGMLRHVRREAPWFREWTGDPAGVWENPMLAALVQDGRYLWTLIRVPDSDAKAWDPTVEQRVDAIDLSERFDTVVEVLDLAAGRVAARERFRDYFWGFLNERPVVYVQREDEYGTIVLEVFRLRLGD